MTVMSLLAHCLISKPPAESSFLILFTRSRASVTVPRLCRPHKKPAQWTPRCLHCLSCYLGHASEVRRWHSRDCKLSQGGNLPLIHLWFCCPHQIPPKEAEQRPVIRKKPHLVEHGFDIATDGNRSLAESKKHSEEGRSQSGSREQLTIQGLSLVVERTVKDNPVFTVM